MLNQLRSATLLVFSFLCATSAALADETVKVTAKDLNLEVPKTWKQQQLTSSMRLAQFAIDPVEGDSEPAELVVSGPFGGSVAENLSRWVGQFEPEARSAKITQGKVEQGEYVLAELSGTYKKPDGPPMAMKTKPAPGSRMLAIMLQTEKGNYFLKLSGPDKTVTAAAAALRNSIGAKADSEKPYEAN